MTTRTSTTTRTTTSTSTTIPTTTTLTTKNKRTLIEQFVVCKHLSQFRLSFIMEQNSSTLPSMESSSGDIQDLAFQEVDLTANSIRTATNQLLTIAPPVILTLGTFGNVMIILLFGRHRSASSLRLFFRALAVSDTCLLYAGLFVLWVEHVFTVSLSGKHTELCTSCMVFLYTVGIFSAWIIVAMTVQRAVSVIWPHKVETKLNSTLLE